MVFFMSVTVFIITGYIFYTNHAGTDYVMNKGAQETYRLEPSIWQYRSFNTITPGYESTWVMHTNWLGMIALGNSVASLVGFFLFKDKK